MNGQAFPWNRRVRWQGTVLAGAMSVFSFVVSLTLVHASHRSAGV